MKGGETEKKKTPWLQQDGALGMDRQTLLMGGLGLLTGDKRSGPGYMLQSLSQGIANKQARTKEAEQQAKMDKFAQGLTPEQAASLWDCASSGCGRNGAADVCEA